MESDYNLSGYNLYCLNVSEANKRGIIVYVDSNFNSCELDILEDYVECMFIKIFISVGNVVTLGAFYRSPGSTLHNDEKLFKLLDTFRSFNKGKLLLIGDFNLPNINWDSNIVGSNPGVNSVAYKFISCLKDNYLTQHVKFPTRARGSQTPHILDLVITNYDFIEDIFNFSPLGKSDHSVLHCVCRLGNKGISNLSKLNFNKGDYNSFCDYIWSNLDTKYYKDGGSVNELWLCLKSLLLSGQELFIPYIKGNNWKKNS